MSETRRRYYPHDNMTNPEDEESLLQSFEMKDGVYSSPKRRGSHHPPRDPTVAILIGLVMVLIFLFLLVYWIVYVFPSCLILRSSNPYSYEQISEGRRRLQPSPHFALRYHL